MYVEHHVLKVYAFNRVSPSSPTVILGTRRFYFRSRQPRQIVHEALDLSTERDGIQMADAKRCHGREILGGARRSRISSAGRQRSAGRTIGQICFCKHSRCTHASK